MAFQLDTSGTVHFSVPFAKRHGLLTFYRWSDLSPFTQGYIEAMICATNPRIGRRTSYGEYWRTAGFSDLAPETLARIIADCEGFQATAAFAALPALDDDEARNAGWEFCHVRSGREDYYHGFKADDWPPPTAGPLNIAARVFPPLTVTLGDDGKVRFD